MKENSTEKPLLSTSRLVFMKEKDVGDMQMKDSLQQPANAQRIGIIFPKKVGISG